MKQLKRLLKKYAWFVIFKSKMNAAAKQKNKHFLKAINSLSTVPPTLNIFTTNNEDGILLALINKLNELPKYFIDIGANDCINSNCANLAFHHGWKGIFIDGDATTLNIGKYIYKQYFKDAYTSFSFLPQMVSPTTINQILASTPSEIGLMSIDLDGNDYHIWNAITLRKPAIVIIEVQIEKGIGDYIPEYEQENSKYNPTNASGASVSSMIKLANTKGYQLVAFNKGMFNLFFVANEKLTPAIAAIDLQTALTIINASAY